MVSAGEYGALRRGAEELQSLEQAQELKGSRMRVAARALSALAICSLALLALAALQGANKPAVLEQEIGAFGTRLRQSQQRDIEDVYDDTFQGDPGHISRAELRFNEALNSAGGRSHEHTYSSYSRSERMSGGSARLRSADQWSAFPEGRLAHHKPTQLTVNIREDHHKEAAPRRRGMTASEARSDLNSYFKDQDSQVKQLERRHAEQFLSKLREAPAHPHHAQLREVSRGRHQQDSPRAQREESRKQDSLMKLLKKAARSKEFQRELVDATRDRYRTSLTADF
mmetsp:Transcript_32596/g.50713  ORF Transcript_32596/g.50713 Transcript_32596/m.50713 type:complete len:284 (-) Transcript_32596:441-1292(-)